MRQVAICSCRVLFAISVFLGLFVVYAVPVSSDCAQFDAQDDCLNNVCGWCNSTATCGNIGFTECSAGQGVLQLSGFASTAYFPVTWGLLVWQLLAMLVWRLVIAYRQQRMRFWLPVAVMACLVGHTLTAMPALADVTLGTVLVSTFAFPIGGVLGIAYTLGPNFAFTCVVLHPLQLAFQWVPLFSAPIASTDVLLLADVFNSPNDADDRVFVDRLFFESLTLSAVALWAMLVGKGSLLIPIIVPPVLAVLLVVDMLAGDHEDLRLLLQRTSALPVMALHSSLLVAVAGRSYVLVAVAVVLAPVLSFATLAVTFRNLRLWTLVELLPRWSVGMAKLALGVGVAAAGYVGSRSSHCHGGLAFMAHCLIPGCFLLSLWHTTGRLNHSVFRQFAADTPVDDLAVVLIGLVVTQVKSEWQIYLPAMVMVSWCGLVCYPVRCVVLGGVLRGGLEVGSLKKYLWVIPVPVVVLMVMLVSVEEDKWESMDWYVMSSGVCSLVQYVCGVWMSQGVKAVVTERHDSAVPMHASGVSGEYQALEMEEGKSVRPLGQWTVDSWSSAAYDVVHEFVVGMADVFGGVAHVTQVHFEASAGASVRSFGRQRPAPGDELHGDLMAALKTLEVVKGGYRPGLEGASVWVHGTTNHDPQLVGRHDLLWTAGGRYGKGVYVAADPVEDAVKYGFKVGEDERQVFLVRVVPPGGEAGGGVVYGDDDGMPVAAVRRPQAARDGRTGQSLQHATGVEVRPFALVTMRVSKERMSPFVRRRR